MSSKGEKVPIRLTTDIGNDIQQAADQMNPMDAIKEFVTNSLDKESKNIRIRVKKNFRNRISTVVIQDDGPGMDERELEGFWTMHRTNPMRLAGKAVRGEFGTGGKAAAFAMANQIEISTTKNGARLVSVLDVENLKKDGDRTSLDVKTRKYPAQRGAHGTTVTLSRVKSHLSEESMKKALVKYLGRFLVKHDIRWNGARLSYKEPAYSEQQKFRPSAAARQLVGNVELTLRYVAGQVPHDERGIETLSGGYPKERNFFGKHEASPYAVSVYGFCDAPLLSQRDPNGAPAWTADRRLKLVAENTRVRALHEFYEESLGEFLAKIEKQSRNAESKLRQRSAMMFASTLDVHINKYVKSFVALGGGAGGSKVGGTTFGAGGVPTLVSSPSGEVRYNVDNVNPNVVVAIVGQGQGESEGEGQGRGDGTPRPTTENGVESVGGDKAATIKNSKGQEDGLKIIPFSMGKDGPRAMYSKAKKTVYVNIDGPELARLAPTSNEFKSLMTEIALQEISLVITGMRLEAGDPEIDQGYPSFQAAVRRHTTELGAVLRKAVMASA